jgi:hypothetical protein
MTTELMLLGMKYQEIFIRWQGSFSLEYDYKLHRYSFKNHPRQLKAYSFLILEGIASFGVLFSIVGTHLFIRPVEGFTALHIPMYILILLACLFVFILAPVSFVFVGKDSVMSINALTLLFEQLKSEKQEPPRKAQPGLKGFILKAKDLMKNETGNWDVLGGTILFLASYTLWVPPLMVGLAIALNMEPIMMFMGIVLGANKVESNWGIYLATLAAGFVNDILMIAFGTRMILAIVPLYVIALQFYIKIQRIIMARFQNSKSVTDFEKLHYQ